MLKLYPEQLRAQLNEGLRAAYLLLGNDPLLLQESQDAIRQAAATQGFEEHHAFTLDNSTDWGEIFSLCQAMSLFANRQILELELGDKPGKEWPERLREIAANMWIEAGGFGVAGCIDQCGAWSTAAVGTVIGCGRAGSKRESQCSDDGSGNPDSPNRRVFSWGGHGQPLYLIGLSLVRVS